MIVAWIERMNRRERLLLLVVTGTLFLLINVLVWNWILGTLGKARSDLVARKSARMQQSVFLTERELWETRRKWLEQHQPVLKSAVEASTLLDQIKQIAGKHKVLLEKPVIGSGETTPQRQTVFASIETKSPWPPLLRFLYDVQQPESFVVFESVNLAIDSSDPTMMRGKFKIARWFAPAQRTAKPSK